MSFSALKFDVVSTCICLLHVLGNISCSAPTCEDDMNNLSNTSGDLQTLCDIAHDNITVM